MSAEHQLPCVVITNSVPDGVLEPLRGLAQIIQGPANGDLMPRDQILSLGAKVAGIVNQAELRVDQELLAHLPNVRIIANVAIGYNNLDVPLMTEQSVWATNAPETFTESTADCTLALLLSVARRIVSADSYVRSGQWSGFQPGVWDGMLLGGKTLGIIGYGHIGQAVARRAQSFGMRVIFNDPQHHSEPDFHELSDLLSQADIVTLHTPLVESTFHLLDAARIARLKRGAIVINMARGPVVDEQALVDALNSGHLGGAGLDVFEDEPRVHPDLMTMPNVVMTPHIGGGTHESRHAARLLCVQNVAAVLRGERPLTPLNEPILKPTHPRGG